MPLWLGLALLKTRTAAKSAFAWITASSTHLLIVALALTAVFSLYERHEAAKYHRALNSCSAARKTDAAAYAKAQQDALAKAVAAKAATEAHYKQLAQDADHEADKAIADARTDAQRYIDAHRVRGQAIAGAGGSTPPAADNHGPGVPAPVPADSVLLAEPDVQACAAASAYAVKAHDWALSLAPSAKR